MTNNKPEIRNNQSGLTLVESLVAITVLLVGVMGPLSIAARGIGDGIFARNQLAANYLAQEALELVVNKRYELVRQSQYLPVIEDGSIFEQDFDLATCLGADADEFCAISAETGAITTCTDDDGEGIYPACQLVFDTASGLYRQPSTGGVLALGPVFTRKLELELSGDEQLKATVIVEWSNKDVPKSLTIVAYLFSRG